MGQDFSRQITEAIGAHGVWKLRLGTAVATGRSEVSSRDVGRDDRCDFGRWLHGPNIPAEVKNGVPYKVDKRLHAESHQCAGSVLQCVEVGDSTGARDKLASDYVERSEKLLRALNKWKREIAVAA